MANSTQQLHQAGQSLWLDNITRKILDDGTLVDYRDRLSVTGLTSNPSIFDKAIGSGDDYKDAIKALRKTDPEQIFFDLAIDDLRRAAEIFHPIHTRTAGVDGWVSLEVSPLLADDTDGTVAQAVDLHARAATTNLYIKVPGSAAGIGAIEELIYRGVPINVTLLFSPAQYQAAAEAWMRGVERRIAEDLNPDVPSVASIFISRWDVKVAETTPAEMHNRIGLAVAGSAYVRYCNLLDSARMRRLLNAGARPQRLLWASTSTKDPKASDVLYVENLFAPLTINTIPGKTLLAYADHGTLQPAMSTDDAPARAELEQFAKRGLHVDALGAQLQDEGAAAFSTS
ncbi:MAG TPA: transaldolase, partial [Rudaea sp.]|nr:transaldolase [Rudaea sp.]